MSRRCQTHPSGRNQTQSRPAGRKGNKTGHRADCMQAHRPWRWQFINMPQWPRSNSMAPCWCSNSTRSTGKDTQSEGDPPCISSACATWVCAGKGSALVQVECGICCGQSINHLHMFSAEGGNQKRGFTLKPPVVGTQPAGQNADGQGPDMVHSNSRRRRARWGLPAQA
jgi:hypothetical protein